MNPKYCYWSVCDGAYGALMEQCVRTARQAGVFKEFHVLTDRPLEECECYDCFQFDKANGLFKLHYLKVGMSRLNFDYFVWIDADSVFVRNPVDVLEPLGRSPLHVPLEVNLSALKCTEPPREQDFQGKNDLEETVLPSSSGHQTGATPQDQCLVTSAIPENGQALLRLRELFVREGIVNRVYLSRSAFWIVHHDAIETVYDLALGFWHKAKESGLVVDVSAALGYALQILCADPEAHLLARYPDLWASCARDHFREALPDGASWLWHHPLSTETVEVRPAIIHLPDSKGDLICAV